MLRLQYGKGARAFSADGSEQIEVGIGDFQIANGPLANASLRKQIGKEAMSETIFRGEFPVS